MSLSDMWVLIYSGHKREVLLSIEIRSRACPACKGDTLRSTIAKIEWCPTCRRKEVKKCDSPTKASES